MTQQTYNDNLLNAVTKLGVAGRARNPESYFAYTKKLTVNELSTIYLTDGFGKRIIDLVANEMIRKWIKIEGDTENKILKYLDNLETKKEFGLALKWARLYGTSIIIMIIDDGRSIDEPVDTNNIRSISDLRVIDRSQLSIVSSSDYYSDPTLSNYNTPEIYTVITNGPITNINYRVHESRILRFDGEVMPDKIINDNGGFAFSVLQPVYDYLINVSQSFGYSSEIMHDVVLPVFAIKGLASLCQTDAGSDALKSRMEIISYCRSLLNGILIDADGENFEKMTTALTGLPELLDKFTDALAAVTGIPKMILMGESPSGINSNSDNSIRSWYDTISSEQTEILLSPLNKILNYILLASDNPLSRKTINDLEIIFNPLWQYDEPTEIDMRNKQAQTDEIYIQMGVVSPEEVATSRFGNENYSFETQIKL